MLWLWKRTLDHGHVSSEGWQEHTTWGSVSRSANFLVQDHKVNNLGCVGHTASVTTIWLCWCNVKAATATTHQRSRSKTDVLLTKEGWDREPWAGALPPTHTHTLHWSCTGRWGWGLQGRRGSRTWPLRSSEPVTRPLTIVKGRPACHRTVEAVSKTTSEPSGHLETIWATQPEMRAAPPLLQVGVSFMALETCTSNTYSHFRYKT